MMKRVRDQAFGSQCLRQSRAWVDDDLMNATRAIGIGIMIDVPTPFAGNVLHERSAEGDVRYLHAATDSQRGNSTTFCLAGEHEFAHIPRIVHVDHRGMWLRVVVAWVYVLAAGKQEASDAVEYPRGELRI